MKTILGGVLGRLLAAQPLAADDSQGEEGGKSATDIAQELANPNKALGALTLNLDYRQFGGDLPGAGEEHGFGVSFQPSFPVPLGAGLNFFLRPLVPVVLRQPLPLADGGFESTGVQLGDISFDSALRRAVVELLGCEVRP